MIVSVNNSIIFVKGDDSMVCSQEDISRYLEDAKELFKNNKYMISYNGNRQENYQLIMDYVISEYDKKMILLSITSDNFVKRESNTKEKYHNEIMYVFGKNVDLMNRDTGELEQVQLYIKMCIISAFCTVVSFHKAKYPIHYAFI